MVFSAIAFGAAIAGSRSFPFVGDGVRLDGSVLHAASPDRSIKIRIATMIL
jgi:hypothetical protein